MKNDVASKTVAQELLIFRDDLSKTKAILLDQPAYRQATTTSTDIDVELESLRQQIDDPLRPGCGEECNGHLQKIDAILGKSITNLAIPPVGTNKSKTDEWFTRYSEAVEQVLNTLLDSGQYHQITEVVNKIDDNLLEFPDANSVMANKGGLSALSQMASNSEDIARLSNAILPAESQVQHQHIDPSLGRLGEISYSFHNGFVEMPNPMATFISILLGSIVDILPLLIAFALFGKGRLERESSGPKRPRVGGTINS